MRQWELDDDSLWAACTMLFGDAAEYAVKPVFNIGNSQATNASRQPGNPFAKIFDNLQANFRVLQDQFFKLAPAESAGQGIFKTIGTYRVLTFIRKHIFADKVTGLADVKGQFSAVFKDFGKFDAPSFDKKHFVGRVSLQEKRLTGGRFFPQRLTAERFNFLCFKVLEYPQVADAGWR